MEPKVKFKDPGVTLHLNGQKINQNNLTQEDYDYLVAFNKSYADYFVELESKIQPTKSKSDGKAGKESDGN